MEAAGFLYSKWEHGSHPVERVGGEFRIHWPDGIRKYPSARKVIIALVNGEPDPTPASRDPHLTWDRYFGLGRYSRRSTKPAIHIFFDTPAPLTMLGDADVPLELGTHITVASSAPPLGIDLGARGHEVRKLFYAGFGRKVARMGYDPEDVLQEVYQGILVRNEGRCPFDPRKSSFGHYVHMVCNGRVLNYHRKHSRINHHEVYGSRGPDGVEVDVAQIDLATCDPDQETGLARRSLSNMLRSHVRKSLSNTHVDVLEILTGGGSRKQVSTDLGISLGMATRFIRETRAAVRTQVGA